MCPSFDPPNCNRQPFLSESGCDRGNVDIRQFDDLPYCGTIDPTPPGIPPEIVDTPVEIAIPPSCSCVNIDYKLDFKYNKSREFVARGEFSAKGDCCEGNYETTFDLQIPCPIVENGSKKLKMKIKYGTEGASFSSSYIKFDNENCTIEAKDVDINLNIPCPVEGSGNKLRLGISYGNGPLEASADIIKANPKQCTIEPVDAKIRLNLPCPVVGRETKNKIYAKINWGDGKSDSASFLVTDPKTCTIEGVDAKIRLNLPCPVVGRETKNKINAKINWGDGKSDSASFLVTDPKTCTIEGVDASLNLSIPCPLDGLKIDTAFRITDGEGELLLEEKGYDRNKCERRIKITSVIPQSGINVNIPCQLDNLKFDAKAKKGTGSGGASFKVSGNGCEKKVTLNIAFPFFSCKEVIFDIRWNAPNFEVKKINLCTGEETGWTRLFRGIEYTGDC